MLRSLLMVSLCAALAPAALGAPRRPIVRPPVPLPEVSQRPLFPAPGSFHQKVFRSANEWLTALEGYELSPTEQAIASQRGYGALLPPVDWGREMVIATNKELAGTSGHNLAFGVVRAEGDGLVIRVVEEYPRPDEIVLSSQPRVRSIAVAVPYRAGDVRFDVYKTSAGAKPRAYLARRLNGVGRQRDGAFVVESGSARQYALDHQLHNPVAYFNGVFAEHLGTTAANPWGGAGTRTSSGSLPGGQFPATRFEGLDKVVRDSGFMDLKSIYGERREDEHQSMRMLRYTLDGTAHEVTVVDAPGVTAPAAFETLWTEFTRLVPREAL